MDATLVTARADEEGAAPTYKKGGLSTAGAWLANTAESLAMLLRPGNAGSGTDADHRRVLGAALAQVPAGWRRRLLIRVDGAGASHEPHRAPAVAGHAAQDGAVHLRLDDHSRRR